MNKWTNMMPVPPLPKWNPQDRATPLKEECQQYYQATIQYHYCAQGYLAHYPNLLVQLPELPAALDIFTNKGAISAHTSDLQWAKKLSHKRSNFTCQPNSCSNNKAKPVGNFNNKGRHLIPCHPKVQKFSPCSYFNIYFTIWYPRWDSFFACTWFSTLWPLSMPPSLWACS